MQKTRRALSPVVASIVLISVCILLGNSFFLFARETSFSNVKVEVIEYSYLYCTIDSEVTNARWRIEFGLINRGTEKIQISHVFVNNQDVDEYGVVYGDILENDSMIVTSLPLDGISLLPGEDVEISIWIVDGLFSSGTNIVTSVNVINNVTQYRTIKLS